MKVAPAQPPAVPGARSSSQNLIAVFLATAAIGTLWFILCAFLSNEWAANEQYSYGWFVPVFAAYLFWLRWVDRPAAENPESQVPNPKFRIAVLGAISALILLAPIRFFEIAAPDWRPVAWLHTTVVVGLTMIAIWMAGGKTWLRHFAFPVALIFVAVPWIAAIEVPIVQGLMRIVAATAAEALRLCGIPAQLEGNLIRVSTGLVGVSEACSGVRSLQTSIMIGLLFGELRRFDFGRRAILLIASLLIAVAANFCRAFFLVWIAARDGVEAASKWHNWTGYSIVVCVFALSLLLAKLLQKGVSDQRSEIKNENPSSDLRLPTSGFLLSNFYFLLFCLVWLVLIEFSAAAWYRSHESKMISRVGWNVCWPETASHFRDLPLDEKTQRVLRFDEGRSALWTSESEQITYVLYFFRWKSGRSSVLRARGHRPDICLPASGWEQTTDDGIRTYSAGDIALPFRHFEFSRHAPNRQATQFAHAFFCEQEDLITPITENFSSAEDLNKLQKLGLIRHLWRLVREGERPHGQQVMQLVFVSSQPLSTEEAEGKLQEFVERIVAVQQSDVGSQKSDVGKNH